MRARITAQTIRSLHPADKPYEVVDSSIKGFLLRVQPSGVMTYYFSYRNAQGRRARYRIGMHGSISPNSARDEALTLSARVIAGKDVQALKKQERETAKVAKSKTLGGFLMHQYGPWVLAERKTGKETLKRIEVTFAHLLERPLSEITAWIIEKWRSEALKGGKAKATVNRDLAALKACLSKAVEWQLLAAHPLAGVRPVRTDRLGRVRFLSANEEKRLRQALVAREVDMRTKRASANAWRRTRHLPELPSLPTSYADHLQPLVLLALNTGLRRGELFQLTWADLDLANHTLTVRGGTAKSGQTRHIPLNEQARHVLASWREASGTDGWLFFGKDGKAMTTIHTSWRKVIKAAEIANFRFHDLRHHFASRLVMTGVDLNTVRELLGHSELEMTLRYAHLSPDHKAEAVGRLIGSSAGTVDTGSHNAASS